MIHKSFKDRTYSMAFMPLCCNIAYEFVYSVICPPDVPFFRYVFASWLALNCVVASAALKFAPNEWEDAPLVRNNLACIFAVSLAGWMTAHLALVAQFGPNDAAAWSAWFCQLFLSAGCLCQLIIRGSSRGTSLFIW
jgi:paspaline synthase